MNIILTIMPDKIVNQSVKFYIVQNVNVLIA